MAVKSNNTGSRHLLEAEGIPRAGLSGILRACVCLATGRGGGEILRSLASEILFALINSSSRITSIIDRFQFFLVTEFCFCSSSPEFEQPCLFEVSCAALRA